MLGIKKDAWYTWARYSEQHFGDYRIPTDTIVYLTQRMPVYHRRLKIQPVLREMSVGLPDLEKNGMSLLIG